MLDQCHKQVVNALQNAGWDVDPSMYFLRVEGVTVFADIRARHVNGKPRQIIVVEVKCFPDTRSDMDELYQAIGQYVIYRNILKATNKPGTPYLAIPLEAYNRLFRKMVVSATINELQIKLILVDVEREETVRWID
ncbi:MAG: XisH protein [Chloroflexi bacterium]|nr:XisH protein [Chloroflexota bacterium]